LIGTDGYNQRLSERRADAVRTALVARGASDHDLVMRGFGKRKPIRNFAAAVRIPSGAPVRNTLSAPNAADVRCKPSGCLHRPRVTQSP
jgi:hypothetical protein